jgi:hypothetical protein
MRVYLSIDLDYWRRIPERRFAVNFFKKVQARVKLARLPVLVALHHHHLIDDINSRCEWLDRVINVDYHSDIVDRHPGEPLELNEGTWANFVYFRGDSTFEWRYPEANCLKEREGYCHHNANPFKKPKVCGWKRAIHRQGLGHIQWDNIHAVGIVLSPGWLGNIATIDSILEGLHLYEWYGRWTVWKNCYGYDENEMEEDMENGTGLWVPRLTSLDFVL